MEFRFICACPTFFALNNQKFIATTALLALRHNKKPAFFQLIFGLSANSSYLCTGKQNSQTT